MNLLIVDDEYYIVQGIVSAINPESLGIDSVFTAYSYEQAKRIIERETVDILITDIEMPKGSGLALIEWVQDSGYSIIPLILTGHQRFDYAQKAITMHCFSYILKPVDKLSLERELRKAIRSTAQNPVKPSPEEGTGNTAGLQKLSADEADDFMKKVRNYIGANLSSPDLNRNSIAGHVHMNPDYLSYLFHAKFGQTLSAYITQSRIDHAKELLTHTSLPLNEISDKTGFSNSSYFHKQFKKATGMTPQQYRMRG